MPVSRTEIIFIISIISLFILIMVTFIVIILFFIKKKQKGFTSDLNAVKVNYEKELYKAQLEIQEQTFGEISREIHDNVGQVISMAKLGINNINFGNIKEAKQDADGISVMLDKALEDLRHMSRSMNSELIKKRGLLKSIEMQVEFLQRNAGFKTNLLVSGIPKRLSETKEIILFRILQEAVNNILRHASAGKVDISLEYDQLALKLSIRDYGKGFLVAEQSADSNHSNGLSNMQYRARLIDADFKITSELNRGSMITVTTMV